MSALIDTTEMYLKAIWELEEDRVPPIRARLTERLDQTVPTVSQTVARMERDGLLTLTDMRVIQLTPLGRGYAMRVMRKHRLAELLLLQVVGIRFENVHAEACRWEHVVSREVEERIVALVGSPYTDPFGNPVPGLAELGVRPQREPEYGLGLWEANAGRGVVVRIGEPLQDDPELRDCFREGALLPGTEVEFARSGESLRLAFGEWSVSLPFQMARHVFVRPDTKLQVGGALAARGDEPHWEVGHTP